MGNHTRRCFNVEINKSTHHNGFTLKKVVFILEAFCLRSETFTSIRAVNSTSVSFILSFWEMNYLTIWIPFNQLRSNSALVKDYWGGFGASRGNSLETMGRAFAERPSLRGNDINVRFECLYSRIEISVEVVSFPRGRR